METTEICLIEQHLSKIKAASCSITDLTSFLDLLKEIASDLTNLSCEGKYRILEKDSDMFGMDLLKTRAVQEFLTILGYHEEATRYVYIPSDENYMKAESCLNLLQNYADDAEISELESSRSHDAMLKELKKGLSPKQSNSMPNLSYHSEGKEERCSGALKNILLSKHLKKEQTCEIFDSLKGALRCKKRSSTSTFNINGYFYQSCSSGRDPRKNRCFIKELFHQRGATNRSGISLI